ncbi:hypothetical protein B0H11DRAFT_2114563 [Mycena galericulata]|nr:hypothetical protein B0H11DRAFT_2114563 [Mycena galericulata]
MLPIPSERTQGTQFTRRPDRGANKESLLISAYESSDASRNTGGFLSLRPTTFRSAPEAALRRHLTSLLFPCHSGPNDTGPLPAVCANRGRGRDLLTPLLPQSPSTPGTAAAPRLLRLHWPLPAVHVSHERMDAWARILLIERPALCMSPELCDT